MARASDAQKAERLNLARTLLREHAHLPEAAQRLAQTCSISCRRPDGGADSIAFRHWRSAPFGRELSRPAWLDRLDLSGQQQK